MFFTVFFLCLLPVLVSGQAADLNTSVATDGSVGDLVISIAGETPPNDLGLDQTSEILFVATTGSDALGDGSQGNPYGTIQFAIDLASPGDEVCVLTGTYTGWGNRDIDFRGKAITVRSWTGDPATTVIDCEGSEAEPHRGFIFQTEEGPNSILDGFTITGGFALNSGGGGILMTGEDPPFGPPYGAGPTIQYCEIVNNSGGGVKARGSSAKVFTGCKINDNIGSGLYAQYGAYEVNQCQFRENSSHGFDYRYSGGDVNVTDCEFTFNMGNGVYFVPDDTNPLNLVRCRLSFNGGVGLRYFGEEGSRVVASETDFNDNSGAGIECPQGWWSYLEVYDCRINDNGSLGVRLSFDFNSIIQNSEIIGNGGWGIDVTHFGGKKYSAKEGLRHPFGFHIENCRIGLNESGGLGGELTLNFSQKVVTILESLIFENGGDGIGIMYDSQPGDTTGLEVYDTTIVGNDGRGICTETDWVVTANTLVAFNGLQAVDFSLVTEFGISCSDFFGNAGGDWTGNVAPYLGTNGNISADPLFCGIIDLYNPYTLADMSPCSASANPSCGQIGAFGVNCDVSGVEDGPSLLPVMSGLHSVFPNPFNPRTTIKFDLNRSGPVDLGVFDVSGRLVKRLVNQSMAAGSYEEVWEGLDDQGQQVGAGVYFLRLQLSDSVATKRMTLIK